MAYVFSDTVTFEIGTCSNCGISYALPASYRNKRREDHATFYCPNGHSQHYPAQSAAEKYKEQVEREQREAAVLRERAIGAERAKQRAEKALERHKKRAAAGICPCCNRTVKQLADHMKSKHAQFMELQGVAPKKQLAEKVQ